jgi:catechol 2,3-dioxygenase-like lactoylglutathione lyase family enzyme
MSSVLPTGLAKLGFFWVLGFFEFYKGFLGFKIVKNWVFSSFFTSFFGEEIFFEKFLYGKKYFSDSKQYETPSCDEIFMNTRN